MAQINSIGNKWLQGALVLSGLLLLLLSPVASAATKQHCDAYLNSNLPASFKQFKDSDTQALYQCLQVSKSTAQGKRGDYHYLSYLHNFQAGKLVLANGVWR